MPDIIPLHHRIVSPGDVRRLRRELENLDNLLRQAGLRHGGDAAVNLPRASKLLELLASDRGAALLQAADRQDLLKALDAMTQLPVIHISFASLPSAAFTDKLVGWFRETIHPQILLVIGLQPSIVAGCIIRTENKQFDLSLAKAFDRQRTLLAASLQGTT